MRSLILSLLLIIPATAEKVSFDTGGRFSVEFPDNWKKAEAPQPNIDIHRETEDGEAAFSISHLVVAKGRKADLDATLDSFIKNFSRNGMTVKGNPAGQPSMIDGKKALVASIPVELTVDEQTIGITFFLVLVEANERIIVMQASLSGNGTNEQRAQCRKIIGSFEERDVKKESITPEAKAKSKSAEPNGG